MSAGAANAQSISSTSGTTIYDPSADGRCNVFHVSNTAASAVVVLINIANLHGASEFIGIEAGKDGYWRVDGASGIGIVTAKVASGTATISWEKIAKLG